MRNAACCAEVPGLIVAAVAVELLGRKTPIAAGLVLSGGAILALQASGRLCNTCGHAATAPSCCPGLFGLRGVAQRS